MRYVPPPPIALLPSIAQIVQSCVPATRAVVSPVIQNLIAAYAAYEVARPGALHQLTAIGLSADIQKKLHNVFKGRQGHFKALFKGLNDHFEQSGETTCPYCNFMEQWEHDHYLPRDKFPEFTLYPNNLIPICKHCNGRKLAKIKKNNVRMFNHLFTELQGVTGFLKVDVEYAPKLTVQYSLTQPAALNNQQFEVLQLHFDELLLADRYTRSASNILARIVREFGKQETLALGAAALQQRLVTMAADRVASMPPNHFEAALMSKLASSNEFTDYIFTGLVP